MNVRGVLSASIVATALAAPAFSQPASPAAAKAPRARPETYGTSVESYYRMPASEFSLLSNAEGFVYADEALSNPAIVFRRYASVFGSFIGSPHLPSGAKLTYLELDSCDFDADENTKLQLANCDYSGYCGATYAVEISSGDNVVPNACSYAFKDISGLGLTVNNYGGQISLLVSPVIEGGTSFAGVVIGYELQVAPAPPSPSFVDVPASDFGFQFIEALNLSGITGGCGAESFCPNAFVTRRQMAIFLAKALGLYLPQY
jgi:hypothetical protein